MKNIILTLTLMILVLALAACGNASAEPDVASAVSAAASSANEDGSPQFTIPDELVLMLGTVKLDETEDAIESEQAASLLPLWKALRSFSGSETVAQAEVDAVISQIEDTMTPEQLGAIEAMELTMEDMASVAETLGIESGSFSGDRFGEMTPEMQATREAMRESGEFQRPDGGGFPGGGPGGGQGLGGGMGGAEMDPEARATAMAERSVTRGARLGINAVLLDAIIDFLEAKIE